MDACSSSGIEGRGLDVLNTTSTAAEMAMPQRLPFSRSRHSRDSLCTTPACTSTGANTDCHSFCMLVTGQDQDVSRSLQLVIPAVETQQPVCATQCSAGRPQGSGCFETLWQPPAHRAGLPSCCTAQWLDRSRSLHVHAGLYGNSMVCFTAVCMQDSMATAWCALPQCASNSIDVMSGWLLCRPPYPTKCMRS